MNAKWTDERVNLIIARRTQPIPATMSQIADELGAGFSRNAVIGKANRLRIAGLLAEGDAPPAPRAAAPQPLPRKSPLLGKTGDIRIKAPMAPREVAAVPAPAPEPRRGSIVVNLPETDIVGSFAVDLLDANICKWPIGDPRSDEFRFCGCRASENGSYCASHATLAYQRSDRRRAASPPRAR